MRTFPHVAAAVARSSVTRPPEAAAAVMATGALSTCFALTGPQWLSGALLVVTALMWLLLFFGFLAQMAFAPRGFASTASEPASLALAAGTAVLGTRMTMLGRYGIAQGLLCVAVLLWLGLLPPTAALANAHSRFGFPDVCLHPSPRRTGGPTRPAIRPLLGSRTRLCRLRLRTCVVRCGRDPLRHATRSARRGRPMGVRRGPGNQRVGSSVTPERALGTPTPEPGTARSGHRHRGVVVGSGGRLRTADGQ